MMQERRPDGAPHDFEESEAADEIMTHGCGGYIVGVFAAALVIWCATIAAGVYLARCW